MFRRNLFMKLVLLFTTVPLVELYLLFQIAQLTSWLWTFMLVIATGMAGAYLAKSEGKGILGRIQMELSQGRIPGEELVNGLCVLVGGVLLLTPGIITDILGFTLIIPDTRNLYKKYLKRKFADMIRRGNVNIYFR